MKNSNNKLDRWIKLESEGWKGFRLNELKVRLIKINQFNSLNDLSNRIYSVNRLKELLSSIAELNFCIDLIEHNKTNIRELDYEKSIKKSNTRPDFHLKINGNSCGIWFQVKLPRQGENYGKQDSFCKKLEKILDKIDKPFFYTIYVNSLSHKLSLDFIKSEVESNLCKNNLGFKCQQNSIYCKFEFSPGTTHLKHLTLGVIEEINIDETGTMVEEHSLIEDVKNCLINASDKLWTNQKNEFIYIVLDTMLTEASDVEILNAIYGTEFIEQIIGRGARNNRWDDGIIHKSVFRDKVSGIIIRSPIDKFNIFGPYKNIFCEFPGNKLKSFPEPIDYHLKVNKDYFLPNKKTFLKVISKT